MNAEIILYNNNENVNKNLVENKEQIFNILSTQNEYIEKKWKISGNGFHCIIEECSICFEKKTIYELECHHYFCISCLHSHINHQSNHNKKCPLCRREISLH
jgi:hypothetical protein